MRQYQAGVRDGLTLTPLSAAEATGTVFGAGNGEQRQEEQQNGELLRPHAKRTAQEASHLPVSTSWHTGGRVSKQHQGSHAEKASPAAVA